MSQSELLKAVVQFVDAHRIYELQHDSLDLEYIGRWAGTLNITPLWVRLTRTAPD